MTNLGHEFDVYYVCRRCKMSQYDADLYRIPCSGVDSTEPMIVDETAGRYVADVHYERGDDDRSPGCQRP